MDQPRAVTATLAASRYLLTVGGSGTGSGTVVSDPALINCIVTDGRPADFGCRGYFDPGTQVTLIATPRAGNAFAGFAGACTDTTCQVLMDQARGVTATFTIVDPHRLTVTGIGDGSGHVTSSPSGIDCRISNGSLFGACAADLAAGAQVTLTATADSASTFTAFSGACTGTSCQLTMGGASEVQVGAEFNRITPNEGGSETTRVLTLAGGSGILLGRMNHFVDRRPWPIDRRSVSHWR